MAARYDITHRGFRGDQLRLLQNLERFDPKIAPAEASINLGQQAHLGIRGDRATLPHRALDYDPDLAGLVAEGEVVGPLVRHDAR